MGAVGPAATPWSTNDDLLLKKALEVILTSTFLLLKSSSFVAIELGLCLIFHVLIDIFSVDGPFFFLVGNLLSLFADVIFKVLGVAISFCTCDREISWLVVA